MKTPGGRKYTLLVHPSLRQEWDKEIVAKNKDAAFSAMLLRK